MIRGAIVLHFGTPEKPEMYEMGAIASNMLHGHGYAMHWLTYIPLDVERRALIESHTPPPYETAWQPPLQTYIVYWAFLLWGETPNAASMLMWLNVLWSALFPLVAYKVALLLAEEFPDTVLSENASEAAARISAIVSTFFLPLAYGVVTYSGSSLYQLGIIMFFWMILEAVRQRNAAYFLAAGICAGVQMLLRSEFLVFGTLLLLGAGIITTVQARKIRFIGISALACILALLVISPWIVRNYQVFGKFIPTVSRPWFEIWRGNNPYATGTGWKPGGEEACSLLSDTLYAPITRKFDALSFDRTFELRANDILKAEAIGYIRAHPAETLVLSAKKVFFLWVHDFYNPQSQNILYALSMISVSILIWCGVWSIFAAKKLFAPNAAAFLIAAYLLMYTGIFALTFVLPRYRIYVFAGMLPLVGLGVVRLWEVFSRKKVRP